MAIRYSREQLLESALAKTNGSKANLEDHYCLLRGRVDMYSLKAAWVYVARCVFRLINWSSENSSNFVVKHTGNLQLWYWEANISYLS